MSKSHARMTAAGKTFCIEDAGSKNGVRVNGHAIPATSLADGDVVELGQTCFIFRRGPAGDGPAIDYREDGLQCGLPGITTWIPQLARELRRLADVAHSRVTVLLNGESGTGKELLARAVHETSGRKGPLVAVNCGAIPEKLVVSELCGYRKGAFSGAHEDRPGLVRAADGGTLFLDEVADLPGDAQSALLRVLQEREVVPLGSTRPLPVDLRVVAATHRDLAALAAAGRFRGDLLGRLGGFSLSVPPLRNRREDLGLLIAALLRRLAPGRADRISFSQPAVRAVFAHPWPMNVRELEHALELALALASDGRIELEHLPADVRTPPKPAPAPAIDSGDRREQLVALLREHVGNVSAVARVLGKTRTQVHRWLKRYHLDIHGFRR
jgi:DNA-binding NtrC family response regulator